MIRTIRLMGAALAVCAIVALAGCSGSKEPEGKTGVPTKADAIPPPGSAPPPVGANPKGSGIKPPGI